MSKVGLHPVSRPVHRARSRRAEDLDRLHAALRLPAETHEHVRRSLEPLAELPRLGREPTRRRHGTRFVLGSLQACYHTESQDRAVMLPIQDAPPSSSASSR